MILFILFLTLYVKLWTGYFIKVQFISSLNCLIKINCWNINRSNRGQVIERSCKSSELQDTLTNSDLGVTMAGTWGKWGKVGKVGKVENATWQVWELWETWGNHVTWRRAYWLSFTVNHCIFGFMRLDSFVLANHRDNVLAESSSATSGNGGTAGN